VVRVVLPFPYLNTFNRGVLAATVSVTDVSRFEEVDKVWFVRRGSQRGGEYIDGEVLNHANTVSVEDNSRKRSYSHSHANMTVTKTTSLHAWCRDNKSGRAVA
jgi:hypothetical protein